MARFTTLLGSRKNVQMTQRAVYIRAIIPVCVFFSLTLICGKTTHLYLSVSHQRLSHRRRHCYRLPRRGQIRACRLHLLRLRYHL